MSLVLFTTSFATLAAAIAAVCMRNLVHCALALVVTFGGLALLYLQLGAQFLGFAQVLVYVGAVSILIVFVILLTRGGEPGKAPRFSQGALARLIASITVLGLLLSAVFSSNTFVSMGTTSNSQPSVRELGQDLMQKYVLPLEVVGLLLTAALIGAVVLALNDKRSESNL